MFNAIVQRIQVLYGSSYAYWLVFVAGVLAVSGYYTMGLRAQKNPGKTRWLDPIYLVALAFFLIGSLLGLDIILELFGIQELTSLRRSIEQILSLSWFFPDNRH